jgi:hypothetical protein
MSLEEQILDYCYKPKTIHDLTKKFKKTQGQLSKPLLRLQLSQKLIRRVTGQGTKNMKHWYMTNNIENPADMAKQYSIQVMGVWM